MIEYLDGGMIYELNKLYSDLGQTAILKYPQIVESIYQNYIDIGCHYLTTCNYGFKSLKFDNWEELTWKGLEIIQRVKNKNYSKNLKILGCLPPYHESYHLGEVNSDFRNFYRKLFHLMEPYVDTYILETQVDPKHVTATLNIMFELGIKKKIMVSIYPHGKIEKKHLHNWIEYHKHRLEVFLINCASFSDMMLYYFTEINGLHIQENNIHFGFYCNKIDEKGYAKWTGDKSKLIRLQDFESPELIDSQQLQIFLKYLEKRYPKIIIGGCCGYGKEEMKELIKMVNFYQVMTQSRL